MEPGGHKGKLKTKIDLPSLSDLFPDVPPTAHAAFILQAGSYAKVRASLLAGVSIDKAVGDDKALRDYAGAVALLLVAGKGELAKKVESLMNYSIKVPVKGVD